jgi:hypothetical protein
MNLHCAKKPAPMGMDGLKRVRCGVDTAPTRDKCASFRSGLADAQPKDNLPSLSGI